MLGFSAPRGAFFFVGMATSAGWVSVPPVESSTSPRATEDRHSPVSMPRDSMNSLKRPRSAVTWRLSAPTAEPAFSTSPSGSHSSSTLTRARSAPRGSNVTVPALRGLSVLTQAIFRSGVCSVIWARYSRRTPPMSVRNCSEVSSTCSTASTPFMNSGKVSNCVHWLYAVDTGTSTSMLCCTVATVISFGRELVRGGATGGAAADSKLAAPPGRDKHLLSSLMDFRESRQAPATQKPGRPCSGFGRASEPAAQRREVTLFGVVIRFEDLDEAVQGGVGAFALGAQHHNLAVGGAQAHQGQDAGGVHGLVNGFAQPGNGDFELSNSPAASAKMAAGRACSPTRLAMVALRSVISAPWIQLADYQLWVVFIVDWLRRLREPFPPYQPAS